MAPGGLSQQQVHWMKVDAGGETREEANSMTGRMGFSV